MRDRDDLVQQLRAIKSEHRYDRFDTIELADRLIAAGWRRSTVTPEQAAEAANALHEEWCGCDSWDGVNCEDYHDGEFPTQARTALEAVGLSVTEDGQ